MQQAGLFFLLVLGLGAQSIELRPQTEPAPEYVAHRATGPLVIDGDLRDSAWAAAPVVTLSFRWPEQTGRRQATRVRLLWNDNFLYAAYECEDTDLTAKYEHRDDPTYEDDAVELFLNPFPERPHYIGLEINARAVLYDYLFVHPTRLYRNYDLKDVQLAGIRRGTLNQSGDTDQGWTIELAVPLNNLVEKRDNAPVQEGTVWTMNLCRWDGSEPNRIFSIWSDSGRKTPNPHSPSRFGHLRFAR